MTAVAVIVAAGKGERFGNASKIMNPICGRPVLAWTLDAFEQAADVTGMVIVVGSHTRVPVNALLAGGRWTKVLATVIGGETRQQSMAHGVAAVPADADVILVHDAARPLVQPEQIDACIAAARAHGGAILAAPITDTVKLVEHERIVETIDRSRLWGAQTPQAFRGDMLRCMAELAVAGDVVMTDEASLAEVLGYPVMIVPGDSTNLKITHSHDLAIAEAILGQRKEHES